MDSKVFNFVPIKVASQEEVREQDFKIGEQNTLNELVNKIYRSKKLKNQKLKACKIRIGDLSISLERTLIIPNDGKVYSSPPNLGSVDLFDAQKLECSNDPSGVFSSWKKPLFKGNKVFLAPIHSQNAFWLNFDANKRYAVRVRVGDIDGISGRPWQEGKLEKGSSQNYIVLPSQSWLEGVHLAQVSSFPQQLSLIIMQSQKACGDKNVAKGRLVLEVHPEQALFDVQFHTCTLLSAPSLPKATRLLEMGVKQGDTLYMRGKPFGKRASQLLDFVDVLKDQEVTLELRVTKFVLFVKPSVNMQKTKGPKGTIPLSVDLSQTVAYLLKAVKESKQFSPPQILGENSASKDVKFEYKYRIVFKDKELSKNSTLADLGIKANDILDMRVELGEKNFFDAHKFCFCLIFLEKFLPPSPPVPFLFNLIGRDL